MPYRIGDVFQINEKIGDDRSGWIGSFVMLTELKGDWGFMGFVHNIDTHTESSFLYVRLKWEQVDYIGHAPLQPNGDAQ